MPARVAGAQAYLAAKPPLPGLPIVGGVATAIRNSDYGNPVLQGLILSRALAGRQIDPSLSDGLKQHFASVPAVVGALLLGSQSRGSSHPASNADVLLIVEILDASVAAAIANAKLLAERDTKRRVSVNVHTIADADPRLARQHLFIHKNRAELFIYQAKYTSVVLFGDNIFAGFADPLPSLVRTEAIRVTMSFSYLLRKFLFDETLAPHGAAEFVRTPLMAVEYIAAFHGYLSMGFQDGMTFLSERRVLSEEDLRILSECGRRKTSSEYSGLTMPECLAGIDFLDRQAESMVATYRRRAVSDIRWTGRDCEVSWRLDLPQAAAMNIVRTGPNILLLRRPTFDYLYPGQWTIPGGYLRWGERPSDAAARELLEETDIRATPRPLFAGAPITNDRLAAFAFALDIPQSDVDQLRLSEHEAWELVPFAQALTMDLTPEARLILNRYSEQP